jgi:hypothetical protein
MQPRIGLGRTYGHSLKLRPIPLSNHIFSSLESRVSRRQVLNAPHKMYWPTLLALAALCQTGLAYIGGYEEGAAERPTNVTGLHYQYYSLVGS